MGSVFIALAIVGKEVAIAVASIFSIKNAIAKTTGITQLGFSSAFFMFVVVGKVSFSVFLKAFL